MLRFSLIACTRGRPHLLQRLLLGIAMLRHCNFELIVICDPNDSDTAQCLARHAPAAKIGSCAIPNLAQARNIGLSMAQGEIAAFIDDDAVPEPDWLDRLETAYANPEITAAGGFIRGPNGVTFQNRVTLIDAFGADHRRKTLPDTLPPGSFLGLTGTNFSVRRTAALALGGFDENYPYFLEETDFLYRLVAAGGKVTVVADAEVHHGYAESDMRGTSGAPKSLYMIARSKVYFCHINRRRETSTFAIKHALTKFVVTKRWLLTSHFFFGRLSVTGFARLAGELRSGICDGEKLAKRGRALQDLSAGSDAGFDPLPPPARQRLCVLTETAPEDCPQWKLLREFARADYEITVIGFGSRFFSQVSFTDGIWQHRLPVARRWRFPAAFTLIAELQRISGRRRFEKIFVNSDNPALLDAAAATGLQLVSPLDERCSPIHPK